MWKGDGIARRGRKWTIRFTDLHGKRREKTLEARTRAEAKEQRARFMAKLSEQRMGISHGDPEATVADAWKGYKKRAKRLRDWRTVEMYFRRHLLPELGDKRLLQISKGDVLEFLGQKEDEGLAPRTCEHLRMRLVVLFNWASEEGMFRGENPAAKAGAVHVPEKPPLYLQAHHVQPVIDATKDVQLRNLFALCVYLGLRRGEFIALTPRDIDPHGRMVRVWRSGGSVTTKTSRMRLVPIPLAAMPYLVDQLKRSEGRTWLFTDAFGEKLPYHFNPAEPLRESIAQAGLSDLYPGMRFHDLRKTFGTHFYEATGDLRAAARIMGHGEDVANTIYVDASARHLGTKADLLDFKKLSPSNPRTAADGVTTDVQASKQTDGERE